MLSAAGDNGSSDCQRADGSILPDVAVSYPASSAWMTGVGGTNVRLDVANAVVGQDVWNDAALSPAAGGGGCSALFARPSYQRPVVAGRVRVVPDVALLADLAPGYAIYCTASVAGCSGWSAIGGTSAATPLLAGGTALIDQDRLRVRRARLGFLNPVLYRLRATRALRDVTLGSNDLGAYLPGRTRGLGCCVAKRGFDAATGLGSVDVAALDQAVR